jgi:hypothetical protein
MLTTVIGNGDFCAVRAEILQAGEVTISFHVALYASHAALPMLTFQKFALM